MYCEGGRSRTGRIGDTRPARDRAPGARVRRDDRAGRRSTAPRACATGGACSSRRSPSSTASRSATSASTSPRATSSRRWPTRSSSEIRDALRRARRRSGAPRGARAGARRAARAARQADRRGVMAWRRGRRHAAPCAAPSPPRRAAVARGGARRAGDAGQGRRLRRAGLRHRSAGRHDAASSWSSAAGRSSVVKDGADLDASSTSRASVALGRRARAALDGLRRSTTRRTACSTSTTRRARRPGSSRSRSTAATRRTPTGRIRRTRGRSSTIPHDQQANHNGGQLQFGPDGLLYAGTGDGGSGGDPSGNAQTTDAGAADACVERRQPRLPPGQAACASTAATRRAPSIFAYGLRNPWRFSFDRDTGDLVIGDVGQDRYEEVDFAAAPGRRRGRQLRLEPLRGPAHLPGQRAGGRRGRAPSCRSSSTRTARRARSPAATSCATRRCPSSPAPTCTATTAPATSPAPRCRAAPPRALGFNVASVVELRRGRLRARLRRVARRRRSTASRAAARAPGRRPSSAGCRPASGRARRAAGPDRRAPALTLLRAAARQHALRTGFVDDPRALRRAVRGERERARAHHAPRASAAAPVLRTRTAHARRSWPSARTTLRLKLSKATRRAIRRVAGAAGAGGPRCASPCARPTRRATRAAATRRVRIVR